MKKIIMILLLFSMVAVTYAQSGSNWDKKNYSVTGKWSIETDNGKNYLVLNSDFKTKNGPDLKLFFTKKTAQSIGKNDAVEKYGVFLGELKSNKGSQKYVIPNTINVKDFKSLVIHCEKYTKVWAATNL